jgi:hypothetical protein
MKRFSYISDTLLKHHSRQRADIFHADAWAFYVRYLIFAVILDFLKSLGVLISVI